MREYPVSEDILMLFAKMPDALPLYQAVEECISELFPQVEKKVGKTQVSYRNRYGFAAVSLPTRKIKRMPEVYVILTFGLGYQIQHPRIWQSVEPYPGRWTHHTIVSRPEDLDELVKDWLREAWDFSMSK